VHAAPPVRVTIGRSAAWAAFVAVLGAAALANLSAWAALTLQDSPAVAGAIAAAVALAAGATSAVRAWRSQVPGELIWDGRTWHWRGDASVVSPAVDAGSRLLLEVRTAAGRRHWLVAERITVGSDWAALRAALYAIVVRGPDRAPAA
jgi:hypothetical protein